MASKRSLMRPSCIIKWRRAMCPRRATACVGTIRLFRSHGPITMGRGELSLRATRSIMIFVSRTYATPHGMALAVNPPFVYASSRSVHESEQGELQTQKGLQKNARNFQLAFWPPFRYKDCPCPFVAAEQGIVPRVS